MHSEPSGPIASSGERRRPSGSEPASGSAIAGNAERGHGYFGSKAGAGVWQRIISQIPPCDVFVEAFAGSATITRKMRRPAASIVIDRDVEVCRSLIAAFGGEDRHVGNGEAAGVTVLCADAISWLDRNSRELGPRAVIYCDPPYLFETRSCGRRQRYAKEMGEQWSHASLLSVLVKLTNQGVRILLSGYASSLYSAALQEWRRIDYRTMTRGGPRTECLWCNFPEPTDLQDYRFAGDGFRERERLKRKKARWVSRLDRMPEKERAVLLAAIDEFRRRRSLNLGMIAAIAGNGAGSGGLANPSGAGLGR
jgi:DNA adenine methylase